MRRVTPFLLLLGLVARPASGADMAKDVERWLEELAHAEPARRGRAALALRAAGHDALPALRRLAPEKPAAVRVRCQALERVLTGDGHPRSGTLAARIASVTKDRLVSADRLLKQLPTAWRQRLGAAPGAPVEAATARAHVALNGRVPLPALARTELDRWLVRNPADTLALTERGDLHARAGRLEAGLADLAAALLIDPRAVRARALRAIILLSASRPTEAVQEADRAVARAADWPQAWVVRARILLRLGRTDAAQADCDRAIHADPALAEAYELRGHCHSLAKRAAEATADFQAALLRAPWLSGAALGLARLHKRAGRAKEACAVLAETIAAASPESAGTDELRAALKRLQRPR